MNKNRDRNWDKSRMREINDMRVRSGRMTRNYQDHISGMNAGMFLLFRCFLALAFCIVGIVFPMIPDREIPSQLKEIPDYIAVDYTIDEIIDCAGSIAN